MSIDWDAITATLAATVTETFGGSSDVTITFHTLGVLNATTGTRATTNATVTCKATRSPERSADVAGDAQGRVRERIFKVASADLGANVAKDNDTLTDDGVVWYVSAIEKEANGAVTVLRCRNVKK